MLLTAISLRILGWHSRDNEEYFSILVAAFLVDAMIALGVAAIYGEQILSMIGG